MSENTTTRGLVTTMNVTEESYRDQAASIVVIFCEAFDIFVLIITAWLMACLLEYGRRRKKWNLKKESGRVYIACFGAFALGLPRLITDIVSFHVKKNDEICEVLRDVSFSMTSVAMFAIYLFLWIRQYTIYNIEIVRVQVPKWIHTASVLLLIFIFCSFFALTFLVVYPTTYFFQHIACVYIPMKGDGSWNKFFDVSEYAIFGVLAVSQTSLIALFVYPMMKLKKQNSEIIGKDRSRQNKIASDIKRYLTTALIVVVSDLLCSIITALHLYDLDVYNRALTNADILVNQFCILATFTRYKQIITVCIPNKTSRKGSVADSTLEETSRQHHSAQ